jgi:serine/threonine protein kinase
VYSAQDERGDRVAIKRLPHELVDAKVRERFVREARILEALEHPALVRHVAHGQTKAGQPYLIMEWLDGEDLAARLQRGPLAVDDALRLGSRLADALAAAHAVKARQN